MNKKENWMYASIGALILSIVSLFLPVISYQSSRTSITTGYNIFKLFSNNEFITNVFSEYTGTFLRDMEYSEVSTWIIILCLIGVAAIVLAIIGITSMSKQHESATPFKLAICGLIGTAVPSLVLLVLFVISKNQYLGTMHLGAYIIATPIAMVFACFNVTSKHRLTQEEAKIQAAASKYIRPAGDLPLPVNKQIFRQ